MAKANATYFQSKVAKHWAEQEQYLNGKIDGEIISNLVQTANTAPLKETVSNIVRVSSNIIRCKRRAVQY